MDDHYLVRMKHRLQTLRKVARLSHDERIIELVTQTADQIEEDIGKIEAESGLATIRLEPPPIE